VEGLRVAGLAALIATGFAVRTVAGAEVPDFTREVRPILSEHCFKCHGPDDAARQANLRLDLREAALKKSDSGAIAIVPGKPEVSELVRRIASHDADDMMPPPAANKPLSDAKRQILRNWIAAGAQYKPHWAFIPPRQSQPPVVRQSDWPRNPIDRFILARLESAGLKPSPEADRYTLIRRLSLDLIGLPPTIEEADAFAHDGSPGAYERVVDRLLASPHYGERWGRRWLDLARYADTNGYEKDRVRSIWPYRDWVIRAINEGMPFDQFSIKQLAGDMLPGATVSDRIATGFHRNTMLNEEGGIDPLEFRFYAMVDRVGTTGVVWMGLTVGCAQCHTHKFDPIPHRDYYRLMGFLNNADETQVDVPDRHLLARQSRINGQIADAEEDLPYQFPPGGSAGRHNFEKKRAEWDRKESAQAVRWTRLHPESAKATLPHLHVLSDDSILASGDESKSDRYQIEFEHLPSVITAIRLEALPDASLPKHGPGRVFYEGPFGDFELSELTATADGKPVHFQSAAQSFASNPGGAAAAIDGNPLTSWSVNGGQGKAHSAVFILKEPLRNVKRLSLGMLCEYYYAAGIGRFRVSAATSPLAADHQILPPVIDDLLALPLGARTGEQCKALSNYFASIVPELAPARTKIEALRHSEPVLPTSLVMSERPHDNPRQTYVHKRGDFLTPTERVEARLPSMFGPVAKEGPHDRLGLARWLVSAQNPLVGRVTMNLQWQVFFGRGLVQTTDDFGYQGAPPTHPELLDWLAVEFLKQQWSMKAMHRLIVTSATYRQSSQVTPEALAKDPENRLLGRAPRVRLEAELIRDSELKAASLLTETIGGPSVFPPQPPSVTTEGTYGGLAWNDSTGLDRYRRGLYTFSKRTAPFAMLSTFDAPSGEACVARREVSNTPLQALTLLNDAMFVEIAQGLARNVLSRSRRTPEEIAGELFRRCLTRPPERDELTALVNFQKHARARFESDPKTADALVHENGLPGSDRADLAAWTAVARGLLNLDETITKE
jgi:mono/diheme cytochrome c family protein